MLTSGCGVVRSWTHLRPEPNVEINKQQSPLGVLLRLSPFEVVSMSPKSTKGCSQSLEREGVP